MVKAKTIKESQDLLKLIEEKKDTKYTFGFRYFETTSKVSKKIVFNNYYSSHSHFLKSNSDLLESMRIISDETYKSTIIDKKLKRVMHFKQLDNDSARERITNILIDVYDKKEALIKELKEGSEFVEFGMTDGCRYIGVIIDYHVIELLYIDPNHLTFGDSRFNIPKKMSYTVQPFYNMVSEKSSSFLDYNFSTDTNADVLNQLLNEKQKEVVDMMLLIASDLYDNKLSNDEAAKLLKEFEGDRRNEK